MLFTKEYCRPFVVTTRGPVVLGRIPYYPPKTRRQSLRCRRRRDMLRLLVGVDSDHGSPHVESAGNVQPILMSCIGGCPLIGGTVGYRLHSIVWAVCHRVTLSGLQWFNAVTADHYMPA
jgi:hypothetical protein